jgi:hypothetical protein
MRVWQGPLPAEDIVLGTPWECFRCRREFHAPVASELGRRRCRYHPGTVRPGSQDWASLYYDCCAQPEMATDGCRKCDHVPQSLWEVSQRQENRTLLAVPAYILPKSVAQVVPASEECLAHVSYRKDVEKRARREQAFWNALHSSVTTPAIERARAQVRVIGSWQSAATQVHSFVPFVRPPEERGAQQATLAASAAARTPSKVVELLVRPHSDQLAWQAAPTDDFTKAMAHELRGQAVPWVLISLGDA